eukprot:g3393.t1
MTLDKENNNSTITDISLALNRFSKEISIDDTCLYRKLLADTKEAESSLFNVRVQLLAKQANLIEARGQMVEGYESASKAIEESSSELRCLLNEELDRRIREISDFRVNALGDCSKVCAKGEEEIDEKLRKVAAELLSVEKLLERLKKYLTTDHPHIFIERFKTLKHEIKGFLKCFQSRYTQEKSEISRLEKEIAAKDELIRELVASYEELEKRFSDKISRQKEMKGEFNKESLQNKSTLDEVERKEKVQRRIRKNLVSKSKATKSCKNKQSKKVFSSTKGKSWDARTIGIVDDIDVWCEEVKNPFFYGINGPTLKERKLIDRNLQLPMPPDVSREPFDRNLQLPMPPDVSREPFDRNLQLPMPPDVSREPFDRNLQLPMPPDVSREPFDRNLQLPMPPDVSREPFDYDRQRGGISWTFAKSHENIEMFSQTKKKFIEYEKENTVENFNGEKLELSQMDSVNSLHLNVRQDLCTPQNVSASLPKENDPATPIREVSNFLAEAFTPLVLSRKHENLENLNLENVIAEKKQFYNIKRRKSHVIKMAVEEAKKRIEKRLQSLKTAKERKKVIEMAVEEARNRNQRRLRELDAEKERKKVIEMAVEKAKKRNQQRLKELGVEKEKKRLLETAVKKQSEMNRQREMEEGQRLKKIEEEKRVKEEKERIEEEKNRIQEREEKTRHLDESTEPIKKCKVDDNLDTSHIVSKLPFEINLDIPEELLNDSEIREELELMNLDVERKLRRLAEVFDWQEEKEEVKNIREKISEAVVSAREELEKSL